MQMFLLNSFGLSQSLSPVKQFSVYNTSSSLWAAYFIFFTNVSSHNTVNLLSMLATPPGNTPANTCNLKQIIQIKRIIVWYWTSSNTMVIKHNHYINNDLTVDMWARFLLSDITPDSGSRGPGSSPGQVINMLCSWERHFTLTVPLSTWVLMVLA